jgi:hypothetical protein
MIDLHVHTTASDGTLSPREVIRLAAKRGLEAVAITDHDTISGISDARSEGSVCGVEVIPGVELSTEWPQGILHVLGYFIDPQAGSLVETLTYLKEGREARSVHIAEKLRELGIDFSSSDLLKASGSGVPGRPHIARTLMEKGYVSSLQEAFDRYLKKGMPAYVAKRKLDPRTAIETLVSAGGVPVLAHPYSLGTSERKQLIGLIEELMRYGLSGLEVLYTQHTKRQTRLYREIAEALGLIVTGGTDFHGDNKPGAQLGTIRGHGPLPYSMVTELKNRHAERGHIESNTKRVTSRN